LGITLPAIVLMAVLSLIYLRVKDHPKVNAALHAARPAVIGLLIWTAYDLGKKVLASEGGGWSGVVASWDRYLLTIGAFVAVTFLKVHPALVILAAAVIGFAVY
jgi:chromate transporter